VESVQGLLTVCEGKLDFLAVMRLKALLAVSHEP
jgi:hypothetical protein